MLKNATNNRKNFEIKEESKMLKLDLYTSKFFGRIKGIKVTEGKITLFVEDSGTITIENRNLLHDVCTDDENPSPHKYESFWGKESILKHHATSVSWCKFQNHRWFGEVENYDLNIISECIHDGVTTFIIWEYGQFEDDFKVVCHF